MTNEINQESLPTPEETAIVAEAAAARAEGPAPEAVVATPAEEPAPVAAKPEPVVAPVAAPAPAAEEPEESFADLLSEFERSHSHRGSPGERQLRGVVVSITAEQVFLDIGYKTEGVLPRTAFEKNAESVKVGDSFPVSVTGRNEEHF